MSTGQKLPTSEVQPIAIQLATLLEPACEWLALAGSLRRGVQAVGDVEIVATPKEGYWAHTDALLQQGVVQPGKPKRWGAKYRAMIFQGIKFDVFLADDMNLGYIYWLRTGPGDANQTLVTLIKGKTQFMLKDGYVWFGEKKLRINTEDEWFALLGFPFIEPKDRTISLYTRLLKDKNHRYGDPKQFLPPEPKQMHLFTAAQLSEAEWQAAIHADSGKPKEPPPEFEWQLPWLHGDRVWVYLGYGEYESMVLSDERARARLRVLQQVQAVRDGDKIRLNGWLIRRESQKQNEKLASILTQMMDVMRVAA